VALLQSEDERIKASDGSPLAVGHQAQVAWWTATGYTTKSALIDASEPPNASDASTDLHETSSYKPACCELSRNLRMLCHLY
jgi:hypothetical protein